MQTKYQFLLKNKNKKEKTRNIQMEYLLSVAYAITLLKLDILIYFKQI